jgi:hypothetical protein
MVAILLVFCSITVPLFVRWCSASLGILSDMDREIRRLRILLESKESGKERHE